MTILRKRNLLIKSGCLYLLFLLGSVNLYSDTGSTQTKSDKAFSKKKFELIKINGDAVNLKPTPGKLILINFWATWCAPCRRELPELNLFNDLRKSGKLEVFAVCINNEPDKIKAFLKDIQVDFDVVIDKQESFADYFKISQMPTTILLNGQGQQIFRSAGYSPATIEKLKEKIKQLKESN